MSKPIQEQTLFSKTFRKDECTLRYHYCDMTFFLSNLFSTPEVQNLTFTIYNESKTHINQHKFFHLLFSKHMTKDFLYKLK